MHPAVAGNPNAKTHAHRHKPEIEINTDLC
jgi:hypothetical protein